MTELENVVNPGTKRVDVMRTFKETFTLCGKNFLPVLLTWVLYVLTIWIPYINVGTTIAMQGLPLKIAAGESISPTFIFKSKYRKYIGSYMLLTAFTAMGIAAAFVFMIIPGFVLSLAWSLAVLVFLDKNATPLEALRKSNDMTYGSKWRMFAASLLIVIALVVVCTIIGLLSSTLAALIGAIFGGLTSTFMTSSIWKQLTE